MLHLSIKLRKTGLHFKLLEWMTNYLTSRRQVVINGAKSCQTSVTSRVPQGSVLGPLLFSISINDITEVNLSPRSSLVMYADDILYHWAILEPHQFEEVQSDITSLSLEECLNENLLQLNSLKCKSILSKKRCPTTNSASLYLCGSKLEVKFFKYLGVLLTNNLSWSDHIAELCSKARKILGLLYRRFYDSADPATLKQLHISLVRPHLEYAAQVCNPHLPKEFALELISKRWDLGYEEMLSIGNVPRLDERLHLKLAQVLRLFMGYATFQRISLQYSLLLVSSRPRKTLCDVYVSALLSFCQL